MQPSYRVQVRVEISHGAGDDAPPYVYRDLDLPFVPLPSVVVQDFDGERFRLAGEITWRQGQHRFVAYAEPHHEPGGGRTTEEIMGEFEQRGWARNRRDRDRHAA